MLTSRLDKTLFWGSALFFLFFTHGSHWAAYWMSKWSLLMALLLVTMSVRVAMRLGLEFLPLLITVSLSALYLSFWPEGPYLRNSDYLTVEATGKAALQGLVIFWGLVGVVCYMPFRMAFNVERFLATMGILSSVYTLIEFFSSLKSAQLIGYSGNASMNGCLIACLYPFMRKCLPRPLPFVLALTSILMTKTSVPIGVFAVVLLLQSSFRTWLASGFTSLGLLLVSFYIQGSSLLDSSNRFPVWYSVMGYWWKECSHWFGAGIGSGQTLFPYVQSTLMGVKGHYFLWLHSDWLQSLFEYGFLGSLAVVIAFVSLVKQSLKSPALRASFMGFSACAAFNYPLRSPLHAVSLTLVVWLILQRKGGGILNG